MCREFENWCNLRVLSGKFLRQKSCYPESFRFLWLWVYLPLILVRFQQNLVELSGPSKNDPEGQRTRSRPELRRNGRFYIRPKSGFWPKNGFYPKISPKMTFSPLIIWAKALFFFEQLFLVVARTWWITKSDRLFWPKISVFGQKIRFLPYDPNFGRWPIFSPRHDG